MNCSHEHEKKDYMDSINIKVEVTPELFHGSISELENLKNRIVQDLKTEILVHAKVSLVEPDSLPKSEGKAVRVIDRR